MKDLIGETFRVGDKVARAKIFGKSPILAIETVTAIRDGKLFLNDSHQHIRHLDRLVVLTMLRENDEIHRPELAIFGWPSRCNSPTMEALIKQMSELAGPAYKVTPDSRLIEDLHFDDLDLVEAVMAVEDHFGVEITDDEMDNVKRVKDFLDLPQLKGARHE